MLIISFMVWAQTWALVYGFMFDKWSARALITLLYDVSAPFYSLILFFVWGAREYGDGH